MCSFYKMFYKILIKKFFIIIALGNTNHAFSFHVNSIKIPVTDSIDLLGVNINKNLQFNSHVKNICTFYRVNNQVNVISGFRKIVLTANKCKIFKAFIVSYFRYCSAVVAFVGLKIETNYSNLTKGRSR